MRTTASKGLGAGILDAIEWAGNKLPDPVYLFAYCALAVMILSFIGSSMGWAVQPVKPVTLTEQVTDAAGAPVTDPATGKPQTRPVIDPATNRPRVELQPSGDPLKPRNLLSADGLHWALKTMVANFMAFPPLGIVLAGMLGVGVAEKVGLFGALIKWLALITPASLLTPVIVFLGVMSNVASDAGYIVLPPLAAALYLAFGRPPVAGIAAAFAGVAAGFSANLLIGPGDAVVSELTKNASHILEPTYRVDPTCNWYFMFGSTFVLTLAGWAVTALIVEPRLIRRSPEEGGPVPASSTSMNSEQLSAGEKRGLVHALIATIITTLIILALVLIPGWPLHGADESIASKPPRWTQAIIPMIIVMFLAPGIAFGRVVGSIKNAGDVAKAFNHAIAGMASIIVLAFFAGQFLAYFSYSNLDRMLAFAGGRILVDTGLPPTLLILGVILLTMFVNLFMGSMSAKWTMLSPILVPMLMMVGISPELTQGAYRVGDSVTNVVTPLNSYAVVILVVLQRFHKTAGMGTLIALMVPYSAVFAIVWTLFLLLWIFLGMPLGPGAGLWYQPAQ